MKLSDMAVNGDAIESGRWVSIGQFFPGVKVKVRGLLNSDYRRARDRLVADIPRSEKVKLTDSEIVDRVQPELLAEAVLLDWSGIDDDDGTPLLFSKERARELLANKDYMILKGAIEWAAGIVGDDKLVEIEDASKN